MWNSYLGTGGLGFKHTLLLQYTLLWYFVKFFMNLQSKGRRNPQKYAKEQLVLCCFCLVKYSPLVIASIMLASIFPGFLKASLRKCVPKCNFVSTFFFGSPFNNEGRKTPNQLLALQTIYYFVGVFEAVWLASLTIYLVWTHFSKCHCNFWVKCMIYVVILCGPSLILRVIC